MLERSRVAAVVRLIRRGYLARTGWLRSVSRGEAVGNRDEPIPWMTYPAIAFIERRLNDSLRVFEYGSGNSTLWWAQRVGFVAAVEHDPVWAEKIRPALPANAQLNCVPLDHSGRYASSIHTAGAPFDIVVNDGRERMQCARVAIRALTGRGVIVWDNSERDEYAGAYRLLVDQGFRRIDFEGLGPINSFPWTTSIFYRDGNCLGL